MPVGCGWLMAGAIALDVNLVKPHPIKFGRPCLGAFFNFIEKQPGDLVDGAIERTRQHRAQIARVENLLTRREIELMLRVADGLSNKEVGSQLNISEGTVKIHLYSIYRKVGVSNRTSLANFAIAYRDRLSAN